MAYLQELDALQRWIKAAANLNSLRLKEAPPMIARPEILWETPVRGPRKNLDRYRYVQPVNQYGRLYVKDLEQLLEYQELLIADLEERVGRLPVYAGAVEAAKLKEVVLEFMEGETLDAAFKLRYEATYTRVKPDPAPKATKVGIKVVSEDLVIMELME